MLRGFAELQHWHQVLMEKHATELAGVFQASQQIHVSRLASTVNIRHRLIVVRRNKSTTATQV